MVPDIGGGVTDYFAVKSREQWKDDFEEWLETPDHQSIFYDHEDDSDDKEYKDTDKDRPKTLHGHSLWHGRDNKQEDCSFCRLLNKLHVAWSRH